MNNFLIDIIPITLLIITLIKAKIIRPINEINNNYLSIETSKCFKGILSIVIILHHLSQRTYDGIIFKRFFYAGYLVVAVFFFFSGYGLQKSYINKKDKYYNVFLKRRLPAILIPYVIITIIYWILYTINGTYYSAVDVILSIIKGDPIADFSWYIISIIVFYVVFWILMRISKGNHITMIIGGLIWYLIDIIFCEKMSYGLWYINTKHLLIIGMIWAIYEEKINKIIKKSTIIIPIVWLAFILLFKYQRRIITNLPINKIELIINVITSTIFLLSVILFSAKVKIGNKVLLFLGNISFEIYLVQGIFIKFSRNDMLYIKNDFIWSIFVISGSIILGYGLHKVFGILIDKYKKLLNKNYKLHI